MSLDILIIAALIAVQTMTVTLSGYIMTRSFHRETQTFLAGILANMAEESRKADAHTREILDRMEKYRLVEKK